MKIGELDEHCGNCNLISLCGDPFEGPELCTQTRLKDIDEDLYLKIADSLTSEEIETKIKANKNESYDWDDSYKGAICDLVYEKIKAE